MFESNFSKTFSNLVMSNKVVVVFWCMETRVNQDLGIMKENTTYGERTEKRSRLQSPLSFGPQSENAFQRKKGDKGSRDESVSLQLLLPLDISCDL